MIDVRQPSFLKLIRQDAPIRKIADGYRFTEGPVFSRRGFLLFSDIPNHRIIHWRRGAATVFRESSNRANGLTFDHQGRLLTCEAGRVTRTEKDGTITVLAAGGLEGPNDLVYAIDGSIYFTDLPKGRVYQITRQGQTRVVAQDCAGPNGVTLSPNQQRLYVADYRGKALREYPIAPDGLLGAGKTVAAVAADGIKTSEDGALWLATAEGIQVMDPAGSLLGVIKTPEAPANLAWGEGFHGLYITARTSVYHVPTLAPGTRTY